MSIAKAMIIGWDGATWDYIDPLLAQGRLPHLAALLARGARATLRSTIPPYTNIAWPSLVTGLTPGQTRVFDAVQILRGSYQPVPTNLTSFHGTPIWRWLNQFGRTAGVLNVPMTFPAAELSGYLVSGFDSPRESEQIAYPRHILQQWAAEYQSYDTLKEEIALMNRQNPHHPRGSAADFAGRWSALTRTQGTYAAWLWRNHPVDLMFIVFSGTDSINHRTHDFELIAQVYEAADNALGTLLAAAGADTAICIVSDHGSTPAHDYVSLNRILSEGGFISFKQLIASQHLQRLPRNVARFWRRLPPSLQKALSWPALRADGRLAVAHDNINWRETSAFALSSLGAIYINRADYFPQGTVSAAAYESTRDKLIAHLAAQVGPRGNPLFQQIHKGDALFAAETDGVIVPDVVCEPADWGSHLILGYPSDPITRPIPGSAEYGTHNPDGIFVLAGPNVRQNRRLEPAAITDVVPTLLALWQLPIPDNVNGRPLQAAFTQPVQPSFAPAQAHTKAALDPAAVDNEEIISRLRALGYL